MTRFGDLVPMFDVGPYDSECRAYLDKSAHYLQNALPGGYFAVRVRVATEGLFGPVGAGPLRGLCVVGRPLARKLPQDGSVAEITRLVLDDGFPRGTASAMVRHALTVAHLRGIRRIDALHDRTRHTGTIYRKAGMRILKRSGARASGWESRERSASAINAGHTPKTRWTIALAPKEKTDGNG